jgi:hypothetical protein
MGIENLGAWNPEKKDGPGSGSGVDPSAVVRSMADALAARRRRSGLLATTARIGVLAITLPLALAERRNDEPDPTPGMQPGGTPSGEGASTLSMQTVDSVPPTPRTGDQLAGMSDAVTRPGIGARGAHLLLPLIVQRPATGSSQGGNA